MSDRIIKSISLYGNIVDDKIEWMSWYKKTKSIISMLGYEANYFSVEGGNMTSGKVMKIKRSEKKLLNNIENDESIKWISVYSLPASYKSASFDYDVFLTRNTGYVSLMTNQSDLNKFDEDKLIELLKDHINFRNGEIYEMDRKECPLLYVSKVNSISFFKTLKVIKNI